MSFSRATVAGGHPGGAIYGWSGSIAVAFTLCAVQLRSLRGLGETTAPTTNRGVWRWSDAAQGVAGGSPCGCLHDGHAVIPSRGAIVAKAVIGAEGVVVVPAFAGATISRSGDVGTLTTRRGRETTAASGASASSGIGDRGTRRLVDLGPAAALLEDLTLKKGAAHAPVRQQPLRPGALNVPQSLLTVLPTLLAHGSALVSLVELPSHLHSLHHNLLPSVVVEPLAL